ncbi:MAG: acetyl-CoA carboxylase carboxyl transferase subunit alpha, partial [Candidatus Omnitrophica bacterium]|nr:acetyl-CoA carboxylase carboxyl transferase subunit alpha [Candidatus Omnitrophota bacterium]
MQGWDFEKPIIELEQKIEELRSFSTDEKVEMSSEISNLETKLKSLK